MKIFLAAAALATVLANTAEARSGHPESYVHKQTIPTADQAFAQSRRTHSTNPAHDVYDTQGNYIGSDPDAHIRTMMRIDPPSDY